MKIIIDTREQTPLDFRRSSNVEDIVFKNLNTGDYSIEGFENKIAIERKSPADLFKSLGKDHERFKRELERALNYEYFAILIDEGGLKGILEKNFDGAEFTTMRPDVIVKALFTIKFKYNIDVIFCQTRQEAATMIRQIFIAYLKSKEKKEIALNTQIKLLAKKLKIR